MLLWQSMGIAQHHDAVSGTSKQHVANDYAKRLSEGADAAFATIGRILSTWTGARDIEACPYLNISVCPASEKADSFSVVVYNPRWSTRISIVRVPLAKRVSVAVVGPRGEHIVSQLMPVSFARQSARGSRGKAEVELLFAAPLPAMGFSTFTVKTVGQADPNAATWTEPEDVPRDPPTFSISNSHGVHATFSSETGRLTEIGGTGEPLPLDQQFFWYNASDGNNTNSSQPSGAYIFRPNHTEVFKVNEQNNQASVKVLRGPVVSEVYQMFADWVLQTVRVTESEESYVEFEYTVGPIPFRDGLGKEVISRFSSDIPNGGVFYTDSNGRQMLRRDRNKRPTWTLNLTEPAPANYYPVNCAIMLGDSDMKRAFTVLNDRSQGGSSMLDGSLELMVHRRLLHDDYRGVGEPLNETGVFGDGLLITGVHRVMTTAFTSKPDRAEGVQRLFSEPLVMIAEPLANGSSRSLLSAPVPQVNILSLQHELNFSADAFLIRLEHFVPANEGGVPAHVDLAVLFPGDSIGVQELVLSANLMKSSEKRLKWREDSEYEAGHPKNVDEGTTISLNPMDIRTFRVMKQ